MHLRLIIETEIYIYTFCNVIDQLYWSLSFSRFFIRTLLLM